MRRIYRLPARVDAIGDLTARITDDMGPAFGGALVHAAIGEALLNAIVYGALGVPARETRDVVEFLDAVAAAEVRGDAADVEVTLEPAGASWRVIVKDPGAGFEVAALSELPACCDATRGRGLQIMRAAARVAWNAQGNELTLSFSPPDSPRERTAP
jgi:hypothetical protein